MNVRFGSKADICSAKGHVRFTPKADIRHDVGVTASACKMLAYITNECADALPTGSRGAKSSRSIASASRCSPRALPGRYNICPTDTIDAVVERDGKRDLVPMRWGLVPWWWKKKAKDTPATFNARAETVTTKPMFRDAFKRKRCLIPASGYYEWQATPTGKQPYYFSTENGSPLTIAGLWDEWRDIETGEPLKSCTMIITTANEFVSKIHDRMPALLTPFQFDAWLSGSAGLELLGPGIRGRCRRGQCRGG